MKTPLRLSLLCHPVLSLDLNIRGRGSRKGSIEQLCVLGGLGGLQFELDAALSTPLEGRMSLKRVGLGAGPVRHAGHRSDACRRASFAPVASHLGEARSCRRRTLRRRVRSIRTQWETAVQDAVAGRGADPSRRDTHSYSARCMNEVSWCCGRPRRVGWGCCRDAESAMSMRLSLRTLELPPMLLVAVVCSRRGVDDDHRLHLRTGQHVSRRPSPASDLDSPGRQQLRPPGRGPQFLIRCR
jgi:hypothetical protein